MKLKKLREKLGLTQIEMAKRLGISQGQVSKIESGEKKVVGSLKVLLGMEEIVLEKEFK